MAKHVAKHSEENPEMVRQRVIDRVKRVQENSIEVFSVEKRERIKELLFKDQKGICFFCKKDTRKNDGELEHKTPIAKGGGDEMDNLVFSCFTCNREKHNKTLEEYRQWRYKNGYKVLF